MMHFGGERDRYEREIERQTDSRTERGRERDGEREEKSERGGDIYNVCVGHWKESNGR